MIKTCPNWMPKTMWLRMMRSRDAVKAIRRQFRRFLKSRSLALAYARYRRAVWSKDWDLTEARVKALAKVATEQSDHKTTYETVRSLERLGCYEESNELWRYLISRLPKVVPNEWRGETLQDKSVLLNLCPTLRQGLSVGYVSALQIGRILAQASKVAAIVEERLVPTYQRSFPGMDVYGYGTTPPQDAFDYVVLPHQLRAFLSPTTLEPRDSDSFLVPDWDFTAKLRQRYLNDPLHRDGNRIIGISWGSAHHGKELPPLKHWAKMIAGRGAATLVSLQYGNISSDLKILGEHTLIVDSDIDQLKDMDTFASQVAAMDGVLTITNTLTHVAGSLNVPTVVLRDDQLRREWPVRSDRTPHYPSIRIVGQDGRDWGRALEDSWNRISEFSEPRL